MKFNHRLEVAPKVINDSNESNDSNERKCGRRNALIFGLLGLAATACAAPEPKSVDFAVTRELLAEADCPAPYAGCAPPVSGRCARMRSLAEQARDSVIAIDERGHFAPVVYQFPKCEGQPPVSQPRPGFGCDVDLQGPLGVQHTECFKRHAEAIIERVMQPAEGGGTHHLLLFIHGGLNTERGRLTRAFIDANRILAERGVQDLPGAWSGRIATPERWYPLFITWPSGGPQSYLDQRIHYNQGDYNSPFKRLSSPLYFVTDAVEAVVRAPVAWAESMSWVELGRSPAVSEVGDAIGCNSKGASYKCVAVDQDDRRLWERIAYWSPTGLAGRLISVPAVDAVGQPAWDAMVSRTRMLMRKPFNVDDFAAAGGEIDGRADLWHLFDKLAQLDKPPPITLIGHSMGAIVVNEILQNFPHLPYRSIVFMGAAASVRDTLAALDRVAQAQPGENLRFFNLSLHQEAEAKEIGYFGLVSRGSLLEWVDRMYTTPATFADRTVGKWINAVMASDDFKRTDLGDRMYFKRFGLSCAEPLKHTEFDEYERRCDQARTPYWRPSFWIVPERAQQASLPNRQ